MKASLYSFGLVLVLAAAGFLLFGCPAAATQKGDAISVWQQKGADYDIWYSLWDHSAKKWFTASGGVSAPISTMAGQENDPDVSTDGMKKAVAVWSSQSGGASSIYYSLWLDGTWGAPAKISSLGADTDPTVAMSPSGDAMAVWVSGGSTLYYSLYSAAAGWSAIRKIETGSGKVSLPEISYSGDGSYNLVFTGASGGSTAAYGAAYSSGSWSAPAKISDSAVLDNAAPTDQRTGISGGVAVFPAAGGAYSSSLFSTGSKFAAGAMPDVAHDAAGSPNGAYAASGDLYHTPSVLSSSAIGVISALPGGDLRPSLTFIIKKAVGLVVFWKEGGVYSSYFENGKWSEPKLVDNQGGAQRNPAVSPLSYGKEIEQPYCGNGLLEGAEQCEVGIACAKAGDICVMPGCMCETPKNKTKPYCGDGKLQAGEKCEVGIACPNAGDVCKIPPCSCESEPPPKNKTENITRTVSCAANTYTVNYGKDGSINVQANPTLACKDDCKTLNPNWACDPVGCFCKETRTVTPRCGDGYVSGPNVAGGGFEECDTGFGFYQPKDASGKPISYPDTCPAPKICDAASCKCLPPVAENITQRHSECDFSHGICTLVEGEGQNECSSDSQCSKPPMCGNQVVEAGEVCESNSDCVRQISGSTVSGTCKDSCKTCEYSLYCGDGIVFQEGGEQCENDNQCSSGNVCSGCLCEPKPTHTECDFSHGVCMTVDGAGTSQCTTDAQCAPPVVNCQAYCSGQGYSQSLGSGYPNEQSCYAAAQESVQQCTTLCVFSKFYSSSNQAGTTTCCCKAKTVLACSDCPGQNPVCPSQSACDAYNPG